MTKYALRNSLFVVSQGDDPSAMLKHLIPLVEHPEFSEDELSDFSITYEGPGYFFGQVVCTSEDTVKAVTNLYEQEKRRKERQNTPYEKSDFLKRWEVERMERVLDHPIRTRLVDAKHAVRRFSEDYLYPRSIYGKAKHIYQRLKRGYSDRDTWNADHYMLDIMIGSLEDLRCWRTGLPNKHHLDFTPEDWKQYLVDGETPYWSSEAWWDGKVVEILTAFKTYRMLRDDTELDIPIQVIVERWEEAEKEFIKAGEIFFRYFGSFWD